MKFQRKQFIFGVPFTIIFNIILFIVAMKTSKPVLTIVLTNVLVIIILLIANGIQNKKIKSKKTNKVNKDINFTFFIVLTVSILLFNFSLLLSIDNVKHMKNSVKTNAVIYDIEEKTKYVTEYDEDGNSYKKEEKQCDIYIKYTVEGKQYKSLLDMKTCMKKVGQNVKIYYDKENPSEFQTNHILFYTLGMLISAFAFVACLYNAYKDLFCDSRKKKK